MATLQWWIVALLVFQRIIVVSSTKFHSVDHELVLKFHSLTSQNTRLPVEPTFIPLQCDPEEKVHLGLGATLTGRVQWNSPYKMTANRNISCSLLCDVEFRSESDVNAMKDLIRQGYRYNWEIDGVMSSLKPGKIHEEEVEGGGLPIGYHDNFLNAYFVFNHMQFIMEYVTKKGVGIKLVRVLVDPMSVQRAFPDNVHWHGSSSRMGLETPPLVTRMCDSISKPLDRSAIKRPQLLEHTKQIFLSYDVIWREIGETEKKHLQDNTKNAETVRWELQYLSLRNATITFCFVLLLIAWRIQSRPPLQMVDLFKNAEANDIEEIQHHNLEASACDHPISLCALVGTGIQLFLACLAVLAVAMMGLSSNSGSHVTNFLIFYALFGGIGGYVGSRLFKSLTVESYSGEVPLLVATLLPGLSAVTGLAFNATLGHQYVRLSSADVSTALAWWLLVLVPSIYGGSQFGTEAERVALPKPMAANVHHLMFVHPVVEILVAGFAPLCAGYVEFWFLSHLFWEQKNSLEAWSESALVIVVYLLLCSVASLMAVIMVHWWASNENGQNYLWRSFFAAGSHGFFLFASSFHWFMSTPRPVKTVVLYTISMFASCVVLSLATGSIGVITVMLFFQFVPPKGTRLLHAA